jgi:CDP-diacylglycerol--glycerol-3-phosphate 3-phosphatidyltransferase
MAFVVGLIALTDFFDGYCARRFGGESSMGKLLDPIADKVFVAALFLFLLAAQRVDVLVVLIFIAREYVVTAVREAAEHEGFSLPVSWMAKAKTCLQMVLGIALIIHPAYYGYSSVMWPVLEQGLVWATVGLALFSALDYGKTFMMKRGCPLDEN